MEKLRAICQIGGSMSDEKAKLLDEVSWDDRGLVPVIVQEVDGEVLTLAYMDRQALELTLTEGYAHYYSRSKGRIRKKGEVSGNVQQVEVVKIDCDDDALLIKVKQTGPACHTGEHSCFYRELGEPRVMGSSIDYSLNLLKELEEVIRNRQTKPQEGSYTSTLFRKGRSEIEKKVGEEAIELIVAPDRTNFVAEASDLIYHLLVLFREEGVELEEVIDELGRRRK